MKSKRNGIIGKLGEKKGKCRDGTDGDSEAEAASAVSEQQESRGSCECPRYSRYDPDTDHIAVLTLFSLISVQG